MNVTRNVVTDLLPTYFAGEASPDTKELVEAFFRADPEFARLALEKSRLAVELPAMQPPPNAEGEALARTKRALSKRTWLMALAIFCTLTPFSIAFDGS